MGRDSTQQRRPAPSTARPPRRFSAPETTSAVIGDFHEPYGAPLIFFSTVPASAAGAEAIVLLLCVRGSERVMNSELDLKEFEILGNLNPRKRKPWEMYNIDDNVRLGTDKVVIVNFYHLFVDFQMKILVGIRELVRWGWCTLDWS